jgi:hypothetical protein
MTKKKNEQDEKPQGFYVKGAGEEGGYEAGQKGGGASTKTAQKQKTSGRQGTKKAKSSPKSTARFSADVEGSEFKDAEDIEQDQDDQS